MGSRWPITPVDMTREVGELALKHCDAVRDMERASSRPPLPVTALAQPELMMMLLIPLPPVSSRTDRETCTGAAWNLLVVKTAAALAGGSEAIRAMSGLLVLEALTPTCVPETLKPCG